MICLVLWGIIFKGYMEIVNSKAGSLAAFLLHFLFYAACASLVSCAYVAIALAVRACDKRLPVSTYIHVSKIVH